MSNGGFGVLIDTNAIARLSLYMEACDCAKVQVGETTDNIITNLGCSGIKSDYLEKKLIKEGYKLFDYLQKKTTEHNDTIQIWFSLLSEIELLDIFMDRVFDKELTRKLIPYRIRRKKPFRVQVDFDYEKDVIQYWQDIKKKLENNNIELLKPEKDGDFRMTDITEVTKIISHSVALDPVDLYLYACGVYLRIDEIYTHDADEFRGIINNIQNPSNDEWRNIHKNIQDNLRKYSSSFEEEFIKEGKITLPKGVP